MKSNHEMDEFVAEACRRTTELRRIFEDPAMVEELKKIGPVPPLHIHLIMGPEGKPLRPSDILREVQVVFPGPWVETRERGQSSFYLKLPAGQVFLQVKGRQLDGTPLWEGVASLGLVHVYTGTLGNTDAGKAAAKLRAELAKLHQWLGNVLEVSHG